MRQSRDSLIHRAYRYTKRTVKCWRSPSPTIRHKNAYATLLPILTGLATKHEINRVTEFGCGFNSTFCFLNREIFPNLIGMTSVENDPEWCDVVSQKVNDGRFRMVLFGGAVADVVTEELLRGSQLILVDDSTCALDRANTVRRVVKMMPEDALLVIHDFEVASYQEASAILKYRFNFDAFLPNTGVLSKSRVLSERRLRQLNREIRKYAGGICPTDTIRWRDRLKNV